MPAKSYIFEQPINERMRIFMRIETLIDRLNYLKSIKTDTASYQSILAILELSALTERGDVKQEVIKELERQLKVLQALIAHKHVDKSRLELTLSKQKNALNIMHSLNGRLGDHLKKVDFLSTIKQRASIPGGSCDFDIPHLRYWLNLDYENRLQSLDKWSAPYYQLNEVIALMLKIIRESATASSVTATNGFYQQSLDTNLQNQILRVEVSKSSNLFPEISAGKHRYSIRFLEYAGSVDQLPSQSKQDVDFKLFLCAL